ncbi:MULTISPECIES: DUF397 domain-containing protein [unclassified Streptomyces]|uniref:DUF397 domain-containing protein n=1 Tax=unclassified Streptomyces TaxID=2593676 RepID=UPI0036326B5C
MNCHSGPKWAPIGLSQDDADRGGDCVEVAAHPAAVHIRDSKVAEGLTVPPTAWDAFLSGTAVQ